MCTVCVTNCTKKPLWRKKGGRKSMVGSRWEMVRKWKRSGAWKKEQQISGKYTIKTFKMRRRFMDMTRKREEEIKIKQREQIWNNLKMYFVLCFSMLTRKYENTRAPKLHSVHFLQLIATYISPYGKGFKTSLFPCSLASSRKFLALSTNTIGFFKTEFLIVCASFKYSQWVTVHGSGRFSA